MTSGGEFFQLISSKRHSLVSPKMQRVIAYIDEYFHRPINVNDAALLIGIHPDSLSRKFKKEMGIRFYHYLIWKRIQKASQLLTNCDQSIKGISDKVGFRRPEIFSKAFKRLMGCSPTAYRALHMSKNGAPYAKSAPQRPTYPSWMLVEPGI